MSADGTAPRVPLSPPQLALITSHRSLAKQIRSSAANWHLKAAHYCIKTDAAPKRLSQTQHPTGAPLLGAGYRTKYAYMPHLGPLVPGTPPAFAGLTKLDLHAAGEAEAVAGQVLFPNGFEGGEAYFVPTNTPADGKEVGEQGPCMPVL